MTKHSTASRKTLVSSFSSPDIIPLTYFTALEHFTDPGHLGGFQFEAMTDTAAVNILVHTSLYIHPYTSMSEFSTAVILKLNCLRK